MMNYLKSILWKISPHNNDQDQEVEQDPATPVQSPEGLKAFTLKGIKMKSKC